VIRAPFPWFGGKSRAAPILWRAFGDAPNYVEPFAGSLATLLARPADHHIRTETVNDKDRFICNFWRAVAADPEAVARYADWPVNEADLHARHLWLVTAGSERLCPIEEDPALYDAKVAGWWLWGIASWIGTGWCSGIGPWHLGNPGRGINRQLPHLRDPGQGINRQLPHLRNPGQGINRQLPHLRDPGQGILDYMLALQDRLRGVRVCCGDWTWIMGPAPLAAASPCAVLLDPPYSAEAGRDMNCYAEDSGTVAHDVRAWCEKHGGNTDYRIALCGYSGEGHEGLTDRGWRVQTWTAAGGYGRGTKVNNNRHREAIWLSPGCLGAHQEVLPL